MAVYDTIGKTYSRMRRSDPHISAKLLELLRLNEGNTVADIGAGTGSYAKFLADQSYSVIAVEPSQVMQQSKMHSSIRWIRSSAEQIPLCDNSVDAAIAMLAFHHFQQPRQALNEISRITKDQRIILFTYDPKMIDDLWLSQYFPYFIGDVKTSFWPIIELTAKLSFATRRHVEIVPFLLPNDLKDSFAAVGWAKPELYFEKNIRNGISSFSKLSRDALSKGLSKLRADLDSGRWDEEYGYLRNQLQFDAGYRFIHTAF